MKIGEMADLLRGLASSLERFLGKAAFKDLRDMAECLDEYPDDTVATFRKLLLQARTERLPAAGRRPAILNEAKIADLVSQIAGYREKHAEFEYADIKGLVKQVGKLTIPHVKAIGERLGCPLTGTKTAMLLNLENWLTNLKRTAEQSNFSLSHPGM
jgi:hypothetical protein